MRQAEIYRKGILAGTLTEDGGEYRFSYGDSYLTRKDAQPVSLTLPKDEEELALSLTGRKTKLRLPDFLNAAKTMGLEESVVLRLIAGLHKALPQWRTLIRHSFLSEDMKNRYEELITSRLSRL